LLAFETARCAKQLVVWGRDVDFEGQHMTPIAVTAADAKAMLDRDEQIVFVDARNPVAWGQSNQKLPGAVRIPVDEVAEHLQDLPEAATAITYCT
jgi:rhodanese-related sulfurtransferase